MALSYTNYTGDGSTTDFNVVFDYIARSHVLVLVDDVATTDFEWLSDTQIRMDSAPAEDAVLKIKRATPSSTRLVDFTNGSTLDADTDLDTDSNQLFFMAQEAIDANTDAVVDNGGIGTEHLADGAVTAVKLADITATGSLTARDIRDRFAEVINVLDYGADKTGVAASDTAFNAAIADLVDNSILLIPPGLYKINAGLTTIAKHNVTISGYGAKINWTSTTAGEWLLEFERQSAAAATVTTAVTQGDAKIECSASNGNVASFISIKSAVVYYDGDGRSNKKGELLLIDTWTGNNVWLKYGTLFAYADNHAVSIIVPTKNVKVLGLHIVGSGTSNLTAGMYFQGCRGVQVKDCTISDVNDGIGCEECSDVDVLACAFYDIDDSAGGGYGFEIYPNCYNVNIQHCTGRNGRHFVTTVAETGCARKITIANNVFSMARIAAIGMHAQGYDVTIIGNHISDSLTAVQSVCPYTSIIGNTFHNCHFYPYTEEYDGEASVNSQSPILTNELGYINLVVRDNIITQDQDVAETVNGTDIFNASIDIRGVDGASNPFTKQFCIVENNTIRNTPNSGGISVVIPGGLTEVKVLGNSMNDAGYQSIIVDAEDVVNTLVVVAGNHLDGTLRNNELIKVKNATTALVMKNTLSTPVNFPQVLIDTVAFAMVRDNVYLHAGASTGWLPTFTSVTEFVTDYCKSFTTSQVLPITRNASYEVTVANAATGVSMKKICGITAAGSAYAVTIVDAAAGAITIDTTLAPDVVTVSGVGTYWVSMKPVCDTSQ